MKRLLIPLLAALMLLSYSAVAFADSAEPVDATEAVEVVEPVAEAAEPVLMEAEHTEPMLMLMLVTGVPDTLTVTLSVDGNDVAVVQGDHILYSEAFPEKQKSIFKIRIEGSGRLCGARFEFEPYVPEEPVTDEPTTAPAAQELEIPDADVQNEPLIDEPIIEPTNTIDEPESPAEPAVEKIIDNATEADTHSEGDAIRDSVDGDVVDNGDDGEEA